MNRKGGLIVAVLVLFGVVGAVTWYAFAHVHRTETSGLAVLPRSSVAAFGFDAAALRSYPQTQRLRTRVMQHPDVAQRYAPLVASCGFDPMDRIDQVVFGLDGRGAAGALGTSTATDRAAIVVSGRATRAAILQCLTAVVRLASPTSQLAPMADDHGHPVLARVTAGVPSAADGERVVLVDNRMYLGTATSLPSVLAVGDHREPGADRNDVLQNVVHALGDDLLAWGAMDMVAVRTSLPAETVRMMDTVTTGTGVGNPFGGLAMLASARAVAFATQRQGRGVRLESVATYATNGEAQTAATMVSQLLALVGTVATAGLAQVQSEYLARVAQSQVYDPSVAVQVPALQAMFTLANGLLARVRSTTDGPTMHTYFDLTANDLDTLEAGARALLAAEDSLTRTAAQRTPPPPSVPSQPGVVSPMIEPEGVVE